MDTPPELIEVDDISDRITKHARGILDYGARCSQHGFVVGFFSGFSVACTIPVLALVAMKLLQRNRIMRV